MVTRNLRAIRPYYTPHHDVYRTDGWKLVTTHLVDEEDPNSNFRSSITLIDVPVSLAGTPFIPHSNIPWSTEQPPLF